jgi:hypothetical protein
LRGGALGLRERGSVLRSGHSDETCAHPTSIPLPRAARPGIDGISVA